MSAYMHMGHQTENLVCEKGLTNYKGIVLSPINRTVENLIKDVSDFRKKGAGNILFDPQLYMPKATRGELPNYPYFDSALDTIDLSSNPWWNKACDQIAEFVYSLNCNEVCSPIICPKVYNDDFFVLSTDAGSYLKKKLGKELQVYQSVMVRIEELVDNDRLMRIASIVSNTEADGYYVIFQSDIEPRRELSKNEEISGAMKLISLLSKTGLDVIVAYTSSDMILYKIAGAKHCATGKFFNLRRFTKSRFDEPTNGGGGQISYRFEHFLLSFLREADILRLKKFGYTSLLSNSSPSAYWVQEIEKTMKEGKPWLALSWRHYLEWFVEKEKELTITDAFSIGENWLRTAESSWIKLGDKNILMEEPRNDGKWIRSWRIAINEFQRDNH